MVDVERSFVAGKDDDDFRNYTDSSRQQVVERHYRLMRTHQTVEHVKRMAEKYHKFDHAKMTIRQAFECLESYVDSSDPDTELPNLVHMLQTAERIRRAGYPDWFQVAGLIHDMGKIMFLWGNAQDGQQGTADGDQWSLGGDTFVVGCRIPDSIVFPEFNCLNKDAANVVYNSELGMYEEGCGMHNLQFAYGHDEYLYQLLLHNKTTLPKEALAMIRFHSCYAWHDKNEYSQFETPHDLVLKEWVRKFNEFDLYTKSDAVPNVDEVWPYYEKLIDKYLPGELKW